MDLKQFYREAGKIVLFPGSIADLNAIEALSDSRSSIRRYQLMPVEGGQKYLTGILIPSPAELREQTTAKRLGMAVLQTSGLAGRLDSETEAVAELGEVLETIERLTIQIVSKPEIMGMDIRMKAREIGANGLVHFQAHGNKEETYMGVPVKLQG